MSGEGGRGEPRLTPLSEIVSRFPPGEWQEALGAAIVDERLARDGVARDLHTPIAQNLSALGLRMSAVLNDLGRGATVGPAAQIVELQALLETVLDQVRDLIRQLNPSPVDRAGLRFALEYLIDQNRSRFKALTLELSHDLPVPKPAARALAAICAPCLDHVGLTGGTSVRVQVGRNTLGWILEVLYDGSSPEIEVSPARRFSLLRLQYCAISYGVAVAVGGAPGGAARIRAAYSAPDEALV